MRNRYLPRSAPDMRDQVRSYARRAAATAASTSASFAVAMVARCFSVAGEMEENGVPWPSRNSPSTNRPYSLRRFRIGLRLGGRGVLEE